jgi:ABC-type nitrate/sulfonate/bicarbonate transport system ATPase subunit
MTRGIDSEVVLEARDLTVRFGDRVILDKINLKIIAGEIVTILGANGVGKTTLLRALAGLPPLPGQITEGTVIRKTTFSFVHQQYQASLMPWYTARRNILLGTTISARDNGPSATELETHLDEFGFCNRLPLDRRPEQLSGGQRQMIALARALVMRKPLVFFDEPMSALDKGIQIEFAGRMRTLAKTKHTSIVAVLHDIHMSSFLSDRCAALAGNPAKVGKILELAEPDRQSVPEFILRPRVTNVITEIAELIYA